MLDTFQSAKDLKIDHSVVQIAPGPQMFVDSQSDDQSESSQ
jgi:hypothetical protein